MFLLIAILSVGGCWHYKPTTEVSTYVAPIKTDTVFIDKVKTDTITIVKVTKPKTTYIYLPDTARRKRAEATTIITGVTISPREVSIERIDTAGVVTVDTHTLPQTLDTMLINGQGEAEIKGAPDVIPPRKNRGLWAAIGAIAMLTIIFLTR